MTWSIWRQHRLEALAAAAVLAAAAGLVFTFAAQHAAGRSSDDPLNIALWMTLMALPALAGVFVGAPLLARDLEQGTHRLVWTQGITRMRWLRGKLVWVLALGAAGSALVGALTAVVIQGPQLTLSGGGTHDAVDVWIWFDMQGPAFAAHVLFAVALGIALGALIGRTFPAMALTLVLFVATRIVVAMFLRPRYLPPLRMQLWDFAITRLSGGHSSLVLYDTYQTTAGRALSVQEVAAEMSGAQAPGISQNLAAHGIIGWEVYQPGDRFWTFQSIEAAIFAGLTALLVGLTVYWVKRRLS